MVELFKTLNVKLLVPIIFLWAVIFFILFVFVLNPISNFVSNHIQENLNWLANSAYSICDESLDELIRSGRSANQRYLKIQKVRTLKQIEFFFDHYDIDGFVYLSPNTTLIWEKHLPVNAVSIIPLLMDYNRVVQFDMAGKNYFGYHFSFDPWEWHIVLIKKTNLYSSFINRRSIAYISMVGIWTISLVLILLLFNTIIKKPIDQIISPLRMDDKPCFRGTVEFEFLSKCIENMMESLQRSKQDLERRVEKRTNELKISNDELRKTKRKLSLYTWKLEKQVAKRTEEITSILRYTPAVVYMKDSSNKYLLVNSRFERLFDVKNENVRGKLDTDILSPNLAEQFGKSDQRVLSEGCTLDVEEQVIQDGSVQTYLSVKFPIFSESGKIRGMCCIASNITSTKKALQLLRKLSGNIIANQEKERAAIARELHDELGQALTALHMEAYWLQEQLLKLGYFKIDQVEKMLKLIENTIKSVQNLAVSLRPGVLDDLGLVEALAWYTEEYQRRTRIACNFSTNVEPDIDGTLSTAAYRITQEALTNAARHAKPTLVNVNLNVDSQNLVLTVFDNGCGFSIDKIPEVDAFGLLGMRERAALVSGTIIINSAPGKGTEVIFKAPLDPHHGSFQ